jgi:hypothetical protein
MKRNLKWTVLAVAIAAASAAQAETYETIVVWDEDVTVDDTRNYETNVTNTTTTVDDSYTSDVSYTDNFEWNTTINEEFSTSVDESYTSDVNYTDNFEWNTTINEEFNDTQTRDQTLITHDEQVDVDSDIDREEHNVSVSLTKSLSLSSDIAFSGDPTLSGDIEIDSAAIAVVDNRQSVSSNMGMNSQLTNDASIDEDTASEASGNLQFNAAAGDNNVQDNAAALSAADASFAFGLADAEIFVNQEGMGNSTLNLGVANDAAVGGNAFSSASGNIGVNVTSGNNNAQKNALAASVATSAYAQASVSSDQISSGNIVANAPLEREYFDTVEVALSGTVEGTTMSSASGSYSGSTSGSYSGRGNAYQKDNFYLDSWDGELDHPAGDTTGHLDMDNDIQNAVENPYADGVGGIAFDTDESGTWSSRESGSLGYQEMGTADLEASLTGTLEISRFELVAAATNSATLSGSAFSGASGNIGVNVSAGTGNQQANSLAMAVAQPSTGAGGGGGGGE